MRDSLTLLRYSDVPQKTAELLSLSADAPAEKVISLALDAFGSRFALVSSFGAESAVLLHIASMVSKDIPVLFLETGKLFPETLTYRDELVSHLGLSDVRGLTPDPDDLQRHDPAGTLWQSQTNQCCYIRKVLPLDAELQGFDAWASGRKRFQGDARAKLEHFEVSDHRIKVNPLAHWTKSDVQTYMDILDLPRHSLVAKGFPSIGCAPCTVSVTGKADERSGRWQDSAKTECGIHLTKQENAKLASFEGASL